MYSESEDVLPEVDVVIAPAARVPAPGVAGLVTMGVLLPGLTGLAWLLTGELVPELGVFGLGALLVGAIARQRVQSDAAGDANLPMSMPS